jgi:phosphoribosylanthranilate isomerase
MSLRDANPPLRTKICGLTTPEDAEVAIQGGADALGFNLYPGSKRYIDLAGARDWIFQLKGRVDRVAVVVNATSQELAAIRDSGCFEFIQFHGDETPEFCAAEGGDLWIRAVRVKDAESIRQAASYDTPYLLFDAWSGNGYGGTGMRLDWDTIRDYVLATPERRIILAGGLTPHNVRDAVRIVRPYAVDVASGVELEPGRKDEYLVREFIRLAVEA